MNDPTKLSLLSRDTAALLLIDHQIGLLTGGRDMNVAELNLWSIGAISLVGSLKC